MYCTNCGSGLAGGARFCTDCGAAVPVPPQWQATWRLMKPPYPWQPQQNSFLPFSGFPAAGLNGVMPVFFLMSGR